MSAKDKSMNKEKLKNEELERVILTKQEKDYEYLYPSLNDPEFNLKIGKRKEFYDTRYIGKQEENIAKVADKICNAEFELAPHQMFVRNFLSFQTPYNGLLLYHGLGSGKTCSAINVAEEMRDYLKQMGIVQRIIVVASPNVQENFKLQLFDERKLKLVDGIWNIRACTGNKFLKEINPMNMRGLSKERIVAQVKRIINGAYLFLGYIEFANYIAKKSLVTRDVDKDKHEIIMRNKLNKHFNNRLLIIDEIHNIRLTDDNRDKRVAIELQKLIDNVDNMRLLFLSATPMYNSYKEIVWLLNLFNRNDNRATIDVKDVFDSSGAFKVDNEGRDIGKNLLVKKATGYVSFVRGENPYMFPFRIWPDEYNPTKSLKQIEYPRLQLNKKAIIQPIEMLSLYMTSIGEYQQKGYDYIIERLEAGDFALGGRTMPSFENMEAFGYTMLQRPLEALNIVYPDIRLGKETIEPKQLVGKGGLDRVMNYKEVANPPSRSNFEYKEETFGRIFAPDQIGKYSGKIKSICKTILDSEGVILLYSQYIDGGLVPVALALEELGFTRAGSTPSLFASPPTEQIDAISYKPRSEVGNSFIPAKYVMITGDKALSPDNLGDLKMLTDKKNNNGSKVKVVMISQAGSEGLDFSFIRQVHVLDPWYNMNRIEQIIGRAVRTCSHKLLPFEKRNVEIYLYGTILNDPMIEATDLYVYRLAELKALQIGEVSRTLKKCAVDCLLNTEQQEFTIDKMNITVTQELSSGKKIQYAVGDRPFSSTCDYMKKCTYKCIPNVTLKDTDISLDTYSEAFIMMNTEKIIQHIRELMKKRFFYRKLDLVRELSSIKRYPMVQINAALNQLVEDSNEYIIDMYERLGRLINISDLYLFQPLELNNKHISIYDRTVPIDYKRKTLTFDLPSEVAEDTVEHKEKTTIQARGRDIFIMMKEKYNIATTKQIIMRGEDNWYKYCSQALHKLTDDKIPYNTLLQLLVEHIVDELVFDDMLHLLNYIYSVDNDEFAQMIQKYIDSQKITNKKLTGILLQKTNEQQLVIENNKTNNWELAESEDYEDLSTKINAITTQFLPASTKMNQIIGFMSSFKKDYIVFKVKYMKRLRHKGARCDQSQKKEAINNINTILNTERFEHNTAISRTELCIIEEFLLRYFNSITKDNKIWFLNPAQAVLVNIEKLSF